MMWTLPVRAFRGSRNQLGQRIRARLNLEAFEPRTLLTGSPINPVVAGGPVLMPTGSTGTGLDQLVTIIVNDAGLKKRIPAAEIAAGAKAADGLNTLIIQAIRETGLANDGTLNTADLRDLNTYLRSNHEQLWIDLHGNDEGAVETGFHLVQSDGANTKLFGKNAVDTVADGIYHLGFEICGDHFLNEDGAANARVETVASWLTQLLATDLAGNGLKNATINPYAVPTTGTGLDRIVSIIAADPGLNRKIPTSQITAGATAADQMNQIIVSAIHTTGLANDGTLNTADVRDLNAYLRTHHLELWTSLHGDDESDGTETGFHQVQNNGATSRLFARNAVDTVADGIYHLGFEICGDHFLNEDGAANARVETVAYWLSELLSAQLASGVLANPAENPYFSPTTNTGLDRLVRIITSDPGLNQRISTTQISQGADAADGMNQLIITAIKATGVANDNTITTADVRDLNLYLRNNHLADWTSLHGDDEGDGTETGFHKVQNDGATTRLFAQNAVDTVADGLYHLGFEICGDHFLNEDGAANARVETVAFWLSELLEQDLAAGTLKNPTVDAYAVPTTGTGLDQIVTIINSDPGLNHKIPTSQITGGARAADRMNQIIVLGMQTTGVYADGRISAADVRDLNRFIRTNHLAEWIANHGDDEGDEETGFHLVQNDGATTTLFGKNAVNTVADGIYHLGFEIQKGRFLNEDGAANASVESVANWIDQLLKNTYVNLPPVATGTTTTGLDLLVTTIGSDPGLARNIPTSEIVAGASAANQMNAIIVEAIKATGIANDGTINTADVRDLNAWIRSNRLEVWTALHGDDADGTETGFHLVQNDGATSRLFAQNAVNTVGDGLYHLGFEIQNGRFLNEDGAANASVETVAFWLATLLKNDLAGTGLHSSQNAYTTPTTGTGLDQLVKIISADPGLNQKIATSEITGGAKAADRMNQIIVEAIKATGVANDGNLSIDDVKKVNTWIRENRLTEWIDQHGDDADGGAETGFHLVQNDGATTRLFAENAVNTVADGLYHLGFEIQNGRFLNEDGAANASIETVTVWLNSLLRNDLANGSLAGNV